MKCIKIRKSGTFYVVFDDDCYILYLLLDYKIINNKVGFPKSALTKVINYLEDKKINYEVIGEKDVIANFRNANKYDKFMKLGKEKYEKNIHFQDIMEKIKKASPTKIEKILLTIEDILDE